MIARELTCFFQNGAASEQPRYGACASLLPAPFRTIPVPLEIMPAVEEFTLKHSSRGPSLSKKSSASTRVRIAERDERRSKLALTADSVDKFKSFSHDLLP